jgi:hypothetical protein
VQELTHKSILLVLILGAGGIAYAAARLLFELSDDAGWFATLGAVLAVNSQFDRIYRAMEARWPGR